MELKRVDLTSSHCYYRAYENSKYRWNRRWLIFWIAVLILIVLLPWTLLVLIQATIGVIKEEVFIVLFLNVVFGLIAIVPIKACIELADEKDNKWKIQYKELMEMENVLAAKEIAKSQARRVSQMDKFISTVEAKKLGTEIINNVNNYSGNISVTSNGNVNVEQNIIYGDYLKESAKVVEDNSNGLEVQLIILAGYVGVLKNDSITEAFNVLNKNIKNNSDKVTIKSIWKAFVDLLPEVAKVSEAVAKLSEMFR